MTSDTLVSTIVDTYTGRILSTYDAADPEHVAAGLDWYARAEAAMVALGAEFAVSRHTAAGVTAALSPRMPWSTRTGRTPNLDAARRMLRAARTHEACPAVAVGANRRKAWAIANGADPEAVLSGPKVTAFYANLTGDPDRPTIDLWAARAAGVDPERLTDKRRRDLRAAYVAAAEARGVAVRDLQAAVWVAVRGAA